MTVVLWDIISWLPAPKAEAVAFGKRIRTVQLGANLQDGPVSEAHQAGHGHASRLGRDR